MTLKSVTSDDPGNALRTPPVNYEAERALLGAVLTNNRAYERVSEILAPGHFGDSLHGRIYHICGGMIDTGRVANLVTVKTYLENDDAFKAAGGSKFLAALVAGSVTVINAVDYAKLIYDLYLRREMIALGEDMVNEAYDASHDESCEDLIDKTEAAVFALRSVGTVNGELVDFDSVANETLALAERAYQYDGELIGVTTGLRDLDRKTAGLHPSDLVIVGGRPATGKEQPIDTPVLTPLGWKNIGDIRAGDYVIGKNGKPVLVKGVFPQGVKQAYRVTFRDGTSTECGIDHLWTVTPHGGRGRGKWYTRSLRELIDGGLSKKKKNNRYGAKWKIPVAAPIDMPSLDLPIDPYILGVLIGDGSMNRLEVRFSNPDRDSDIRRRFEALLPSGVELKENRSGACPYYRLRGPGFALFRDKLRAMKITVKSIHKFIPEIYKRASIPQRMALLRGLMDTDGTCSGGNASSYCTMSEMLADDVNDLVKSLGGVSWKTKSDRTHHEKGIEFSVIVRMPICPFTTAFKKARWKEREVSRYIWNVEKSRVVEQVCISVDSQDGLYLTNDYIVTHNTGLATSIAMNAARYFKTAERADHKGKRVAFFSLEMSRDQLMTRIFAHESKIDSFAIRGGNLNEAEFTKLILGRQNMGTMPLYIDDTPAATVGQIRSRARRLARKGAGSESALGLIVIDYIQLIASIGKDRSDNRANELGLITRGLKALAKELNVPIIALSQLSRGLESREDKRPQLADLRDSGSIESDADMVWFTYREQYYLERAEPKQTTNETAERFSTRLLQWSNQSEAARGKGEVIVAKQRQGPLGTVTLAFESIYAWWSNLGTDAPDDNMLL